MNVAKTLETLQDSLGTKQIFNLTPQNYGGTQIRHPPDMILQLQIRNLKTIYCHTQLNSTQVGLALFSYAKTTPYFNPTKRFMPKKIPTHIFFDQIFFPTQYFFTQICFA